MLESTKEVVVRLGNFILVMNIIRQKKKKKLPKNILKQILIYTIPYKGSNLTTLKNSPK